MARDPQISALLREGDDLQHVDERQIFELAFESHGMLLPLILDATIRAARPRAP